MRPKDPLDEISGRIRGILDSSTAKNVEENIRAMLSSAFSRLDLVTREEFDVQAKVLSRTREKLEALQSRISELENRLGRQP